MINLKYFLDGIEIFPQNAGTHNLFYEKRSPESFEFVQKMDGEIICDFESGSFDFKAYEANDLCTEIEFKILKKCSTGYETYFIGITSMTECKFDNDQCVVRFTPRSKEFMIEDLAVDILKIPTAVGTGGLSPTSGVFTGTGGGQRNYTQAKYFKDVVLYVAQQSNSNIVQIVSDFFQINPETVSNYALPGISNTFYLGNSMVFCALSDVQEPVPSDNATSEFVKFGDLMHDLGVLFDVGWYIDADGNLRIEHRTFFSGDVGLDLTQSKYANHLKGTDKYSYSIEEYPRYETWRIVDAKDYCRLTFSGCGAIGKNKNETQHTTRVIRTNYYNIRYLGQNSIADGLFLFATDGGGVGGYQMVENSLGQNYTLNITSLVMKFHRYNRPELNSLLEYFHGGNDLFIQNQGDFLAYSVKPTKVQEEISIPFCCDDVFDTKKIFKTKLGNGYLEKASFVPNQELLKLQLKYKTVYDDPDILPIHLPNLRLWLRADKGIVENGFGDVSQWTDYSGNGNHATQAVPADQPVHLVSGGLDFIKFTNQFLATPAFQLFPSKRGTIMIVCNLPTPVSVPGNLSIISTNDGGAGVFFDFSRSNSTPDPDFGSNNLALSYPFFSLGGLFNFDRTSNTQMYVRQNGILPTTNYPHNTATNPVVVPNTQIDSKPLIIGKNANLGGFGADVSIFEIIIYDTVLTEVQRQKLELYLVKKWKFNIYTGI